MSIEYPELLDEPLLPPLEELTDQQLQRIHRRAVEFLASGPIPPGHLIVFKLLLEAGEEGVTRKELLQEMGTGKKGFTGVLASMQQRAAKPLGGILGCNTYLIEELRDEDQQVSYRLRAPLFEALTKFDELKEILALPTSDIRIEFGHESDWFQLENAFRKNR